jgi:hypothetical protein
MSGLADERIDQSVLIAELAILSSKLAAAMDALNAAAAANKQANATDLDASAVLIRHQDDQANTAAALTAAKKEQHARMRAKLQQRKQARAETATALAAMAESVDQVATHETGRTEARSATEQAELEVLFEQAAKKRDQLEMDMIELAAESAATQVENGAAVQAVGVNGGDGEGGDEEEAIRQELAAERDLQATLARQMSELNAKLAAALQALSAANATNDAAAEAKDHAMDASVVLIKHQEAQGDVTAQLATARGKQQAKMKARLQQRRQARDEAATQLAALTGQLDTLDNEEAASADDEVQQEVRAESISKKRDAWCA